MGRHHVEFSPEVRGITEVLYYGQVVGVLIRRFGTSHAWRLSLFVPREFKTEMFCDVYTAEANTTRQVINSYGGKPPPPAPVAPSFDTEEF